MGGSLRRTEVAAEEQHLGFLLPGQVCQAAQEVPAFPPPFPCLFHGQPAKALARWKGVKTATASAYPMYALEKEPLPEAGEYSVILDSREQAA